MRWMSWLRGVGQGQALKLGLAGLGWTSRTGQDRAGQGRLVQGGAVKGLLFSSSQDVA